MCRRIPQKTQRHDRQAMIAIPPRRCPRFLLGPDDSGGMGDGGGDGYGASHDGDVGDNGDSDDDHGQNDDQGPLSQEAPPPGHSRGQVSRQSPFSSGSSRCPRSLGAFRPKGRNH